MDLVQFLVSLLDLHKQQLQVLTRQGEIQGEVLAQLLKQDQCEKLCSLSFANRKLHIPRMNMEDMDTEAYLVLFEQAAARCRLPREQWGIKLAELLCDMDAETFPMSQFQNYDALKNTLLSQAQAVEDQCRMDFLSVKYDPQKGVRYLGENLDLAAKRWLRPERRTSAQVEQLVAVEKFISLLPKEAGVWVHRRHPRDMEEAIFMAEQYLDCSSPKDSSTNVSADAPGEMTGRLNDTAEATDAKTRKTSVNVDIKESFIRSTQKKLDIMKKESVQFNAEIPEIQVVCLENEDVLGISVPVFKEEVSEQDNLGSFEMLQSSEVHELHQQDSASAVFPSPSSSLGLAISDLSAAAAPQPSMPLSVPLPPERSLPHSQGAEHKTSDNDKWDNLKCSESRRASFPKSIQKTCLPKIKRMDHFSNTLWDRGKLDYHQKTYAGERTHHCPDCGRTFTQVSSLQEHRNIHTGEKPFRCEVCGKAFHHRRTLNKHSRVHSRERPFHCTQCGSTFKLKDALKRHQMTHNKEKYSNSCAVKPDFQKLAEFHSLAEQFFQTT
ncbi:zinc finger protein 397-like [Scleropages formosus]|uniref:zinc finger protein 397-like n=1 Tax=Scleropages formosus TaxID=113540 RepID=UPI0010FAA773|nr:zinc finger protein 397-like [Scleropages formosus]